MCNNYLFVIALPLVLFMGAFYRASRRNDRRRNYAVLCHRDVNPEQAVQQLDTNFLYNTSAKCVIEIVSTYSTSKKLIDV